VRRIERTKWYGASIAAHNGQYADMAAVIGTAIIATPDPG
jgi:hypothetical protein